MCNLSMLPTDRLLTDGLADWTNAQATDDSLLICTHVSLVVTSDTVFSISTIATANRRTTPAAQKLDRTKVDDLPRQEQVFLAQLPSGHCHRQHHRPNNEHSASKMPSVTINTRTLAEHLPGYSSTRTRNSRHS